MIPIFKVKLSVVDGTGQGIFAILDQDICDLLGKKCHELLTVLEGDHSESYPTELGILKGKKLLLKVEKSNTHDYEFSKNPFQVERLCADLSLIDAFDSPFLNEATESEDDEVTESEDDG
ncbi:hypothetical protein P8452_71902 [Trifolium repens]|nr:hypothetical protein P8452_71902 [Trifolium repens]